MKKINELDASEAEQYFLKGSSYFNGDFPPYISFEPILKDVSKFLKGNSYNAYQATPPERLPGVNYSLVSNKDGRFAWRPYELMHPVIYVSLVNTICSKQNWATILGRFQDYSANLVKCCSLPVVSTDGQKDQAAQITNWWHEIEQQSLIYSLEYSHLLHTDVKDCYGSLYTHSISWAIHGLEEAKGDRNGKRLGDKIDGIIRAGRYGQTNGISQGSVLMDFIAELVIGYVDELITKDLRDCNDLCVLRYRDDYRIFANSDVRAEYALKVISDKLRGVGMCLGVSKTILSKNVIEGSVKPDKLAGIELQDLGVANAKTLQKQMLRLHTFGQRFPNSGALRRLVSDLQSKVLSMNNAPDDLEVQVAVVTDIAVTSPSTFPAVAGMLSHLISLAPSVDKGSLWDKVCKKLKCVPYNGYMEVWLQRVIIPRNINVDYASTEDLCRIVRKEETDLWNNDWISARKLKDLLDTSKIIISEPADVSEVMKMEESELYRKSALAY